MPTFMRGLVLAMRSRALRRALLLFLPVSGAITVVLLPLALLYDHSRRETVQTRLTAMAAGARLQVQQVLQEVEADTGLAASLAAGVGSPEQWRQLGPLFKAQVREYPRYSAIAVFDRAGGPLLQVQANGVHVNREVLQAAVDRGLRLAPNQLWLSPVFWPAPAGAPALLAVRPLAAGALVYVTSLGPVVASFDQATNNTSNHNSAHLRGYLLSPSGQVLNPASGGPGVNFAARYPTVWQQMERRAQGVVQTSQGLFVYDAGRQNQGLGVVIQVLPGPNARNSLFSQPLALALMGVVYLLVGASSAAIAIAQERVDRLREQEHQAGARLKAVLVSAGMGMGICDPGSGQFHTVNGALCQLLQRSDNELVGRNWLDFCHPDDQAAAEALVEQLLSGTGAQQRCRLRFQRPDGQTVWGDLVLACTDGAAGQPDSLIVQIADVTELVAQAAYLEAAAEAGIVGVWDWEIPRNVLTWDPVMYRLYGRTRDQFAGAYEAWASAIHPEDRSYVEAEIQAAVKGWRPYQPRFRVVWPDGSVHHLQARSRTTYSADGRALRMIGVNYDITDQVVREGEIDQQRALLAATLNALVDPQLLLTQAPELRIAQVNPAAASFFGRSVNQLIGRLLTELLPAEDNTSLMAKLAAVSEQAEPLIADEIPLQLSLAPEPLHVDLRAAAVRDGVSVSFRDVSERRRASQQLAASEERFRLLALNVTDVVFLCEAGWIEWIAPGITSALGWLPADWCGQRLDQFCHPDDLGRLESVLEQVEQGRRVILRARMQDKGRHWRWLEIHAGPYRNGEGEQRGLVGALRVVDEEVAAETELDRRARNDALTGLLNRQEILERLEQLHQHRRLTDRSVALMFCDIDHFKAINDQHGHSGGDAVLQALAQRLQGVVRRGDLVGRFGGDELLVVLQSVPSLEAAETIATKMHEIVHQPLSLPTGEVHPTLSIGVTLIKPDEPLNAVIARADQAMYQAKQHGRDRVIAFV